MIHDAGQIRIREHYATEWGSPQNLARCGFSAIAKEKTWLRVEVCVPPAVQDDSRDVPPRIEPGAREHIGKLLTNLPLVFTERGTQHLSSAAVSLICDRHARIGIQHFERKHQFRTATFAIKHGDR